MSVPRWSEIEKLRGRILIWEANLAGANFSGAKFIESRRRNPRGRTFRGRNVAKFGGGCIRAIIYRTLYRTLAPGAQIFPLIETKLGSETQGRKVGPKKKLRDIQSPLTVWVGVRHLISRYAFRESHFTSEIDTFYPPPKKGSKWTPIFVWISKKIFFVTDCFRTGSSVSIFICLVKTMGKIKYFFWNWLFPDRQLDFRNHLSRRNDG